VKERKLALTDGESLTLLAKCLSGRRIEILRSIAQKKQSLGEIAREVGVHRGFLAETVNLLQGQQLVRVVRVGKKKVPELLVERIVVQLQEGR